MKEWWFILETCLFFAVSAVQTVLFGVSLYRDQKATARGETLRYSPRQTLDAMDNTPRNHNHAHNNNNKGSLHNHHWLKMNFGYYARRFGLAGSLLSMLRSVDIRGSLNLYPESVVSVLALLVETLYFVLFSVLLWTMHQTLIYATKIKQPHQASTMVHRYSPAKNVWYVLLCLMPCVVPFVFVVDQVTTLKISNTGVLVTNAVVIALYAVWVLHLNRATVDLETQQNTSQLKDSTMALLNNTTNTHNIRESPRLIHCYDPLFHDVQVRFTRFTWFVTPCAFGMVILFLCLAIVDNSFVVGLLLNLCGWWIMSLMLWYAYPEPPLVKPQAQTEVAPPPPPQVNAYMVPPSVPLVVAPPTEPVLIPNRRPTLPAGESEIFSVTPLKLHHLTNQLSNPSQQQLPPQHQLPPDIMSRIHSSHLLNVPSPEGGGVRTLPQLSRPFAQELER